MNSTSTEFHYDSLKSINLACILGESDWGDGLLQEILVHIKTLDGYRNIGFITSMNSAYSGSSCK